jgi:hypothetical protein
MKTKLVPWVLLIPAVVLAQPAPVPSSQAGMSPSSEIPAPPVNPAIAADALNTAKKQAKELKSMLPSNGEVGSGFITSSIGLS